MFKPGFAFTLLLGPPKAHIQNLYFISFCQEGAGGFWSMHRWVLKKNVLVFASITSSISSFGENNDNLSQLINSTVAQLLAIAKKDSDNKL